MFKILNHNTILALFSVFSIFTKISAQEIVTGPVLQSIKQNLAFPACGSFDFIKNADQNTGKFMDFSNQLI